MEDLTLVIDSCENKLIQEIKNSVEKTLIDYQENFNVVVSYDLRNSAIIHTYKTIRKKYYNNSNFEDKKFFYIKIVSENYISKLYLQFEK